MGTGASHPHGRIWQISSTTVIAQRQSSVPSVRPDTARATGSPPPPLSVSELDNLMERRDVDRVIITVNAPNGKAAIAADTLPSPVRGGSALSKREWLRQLQGPPQESDLNLIMLMMSTSTRLSGDPPSMPDREMGLVASISYRVELDSHYLPCDLGPAAMDAARSAWFVDICIIILFTALSRRGHVATRTPDSDSRRGPVYPEKVPSPRVVTSDHGGGGALPFRGTRREWTGIIWDENVMDPVFQVLRLPQSSYSVWKRVGKGDQVVARVDAGACRVVGEPWRKLSQSSRTRNHRTLQQAVSQFD